MTKDDRARLNQTRRHPFLWQRRALAIKPGKQRYRIGHSLLSKCGDNGRSICRRKPRENRPIDQRRRLLIGHADVAGPCNGEVSIGRGSPNRYSCGVRKGLRDLGGTLHQRDGRLRQPDMKAALWSPVQEGIERHHVLDLHAVDAETLRDTADRLVGQVTEAILNGLHDIHQTAAVGAKFLDQGVDRRP